MDCNKNRKNIIMVLRILVLTFVLVAAFSLAGCAKEAAEEPDQVKYPDNAVIIDDTTKMPALIPSGNPAVVDLDGDGEDDIVEFVLDSSDDTAPPVASSFTINGTEFKELLYDDFLLTMDSPWADGFYIVDIDTEDNLLEIAILDEGPSSDQVTFFFRYSEGELTYIGDIPDFPESKTCSFAGDGTVTAQLRLSVLQTWWAPATWRLNQQDRLQQDSQTAYIPYEDWNKSVLLEDLPLSPTKALVSNTIVAPKGSAVTFVETDNIHWIKLQTNGGVTGWFYLDGYSTMMVNGEPRETTEIFKDLLFAD